MVSLSRFDSARVEQTDRRTEWPIRILRMYMQMRRAIKTEKVMADCTVGVDCRRNTER